MPFIVVVGFSPVYVGEHGVGGKSVQEPEGSSLLTITFEMGCRPAQTKRSVREPNKIPRRLLAPQWAQWKKTFPPPPKFPAFTISPN